MAAALGPARSRELEAPGHSPAQPSPALVPSPIHCEEDFLRGWGRGARLGDRGPQAESRGLFGLRPPPLSPPPPQVQRVSLRRGEPSLYVALGSGLSAIPGWKGYGRHRGLARHGAHARYHLF
ncbi:zinc finger protein 518A isoform 2-T4 [Sarcophilus harrisii]